MYFQVHTGRNRNHSSLQGIRRLLKEPLLLVALGFLDFLGLVLVLNHHQLGTIGKCCVEHTGRCHNHSSWQGNQVLWNALASLGVLVLGVLVLVPAAVVLVQGLNHRLGTIGKCYVEHTGTCHNHSSLQGNQVLWNALVLLAVLVLVRAVVVLEKGLNHHHQLGTIGKCCVEHTGRCHNHSSWQGNQVLWNALEPPHLVKKLEEMESMHPDSRHTWPQTRKDKSHNPHRHEGIVAP